MHKAVVCHSAVISRENIKKFSFHFWLSFRFRSKLTSVFDRSLQRKQKQHQTGSRAEELIKRNVACSSRPIGFENYLTDAQTFLTQNHIKLQTSKTKIK